MTPITFTQAIPLTSQNVTDALGSFFSVGPVLGVLAIMIALFMVPWLVRAFRSFIFSPGSESWDASGGWVTVEGDLVGTLMEYDRETGYGYTGHASTPSEMDEASGAR